MGMAANAAQYGIMTAHFYWLGAIPAMVFLAVFMMPFYYKSKIRSVPEYLRKRFNEPTRAFNAFSFAIMTVLMSGMNLYFGLACACFNLACRLDCACLHHDWWLDFIYL